MPHSRADVAGGVSGRAHTDWDGYGDLPSYHSATDAVVNADSISDAKPHADTPALFDPHSNCFG